MPATAPEAIDGRQGRTARSRRAICEAALDLVQEGVLQPSADQVAERAGLSRRSVFNHFADLAELYDAVVEVGLQRCAPLLEEISEEDPLPLRVERLAAARSRFLEATSAFTRALTAQALIGPGARDASRISRYASRLQHEEVERLFGGSLAGLPAAERAETLEAISAALAPTLWEFLRHTRGHAPARARAVMERSVRAILREAGAGL